MSTGKTIRNGGDQALSLGLQARFGKTDTLTLNGAKLTIPEIVSQLQSRIDASNAAEKQKAEAAAAVQAERDALARTHAMVLALKQVLLAMFGRSSEVLIDFGLAPRKTTKPLATKDAVVAQAKAQATRVARHTMGKRQKSAVKGHTADPSVPTSTPLEPASPAPRSVNAANGTAVK
jgi:hypothetical protein